ncbi:MAG: hypothetical protein M3461_19255 [Pseudomonadota bacterium]|nr:hypothetical protein [Pseudomonadota bacterium]
MLANWPFVVTNMLMLTTAGLGQWIARTGAAKRQAGKENSEELDSRGGVAGKSPQSSRRQRSHLQPIMPSSSKYQPRAACERHHGLRGAAKRAASGVYRHSVNTAIKASLIKPMRRGNR